MLTRKIKLISIVLLVSTSSTLHALTPGQVFNKVKNSVFVIKVLDKNGNNISQGSGVLLPSGMIGTNCHVVMDGHSFLIGGGKTYSSASIWGGDEDKDICLLKAKGINGKRAEIGAEKKSKVGDKVFAIGAPQGLELSLSDGIISQIRGELIQTTAAISHGSSGGGLFDDNGKLIGLTTSYVEGSQSLNFAMPVEWIKTIDQGLKRAEGESGNTWLKQSLIIINNQDWTELKRHAKDRLNSQPDDVDAMILLGVALGKLGKSSEAIVIYRQALIVNPSNASTWLVLADAYKQANMHMLASDAYRQSAELDPSQAQAWVGLGSIYQHLGSFTNAVNSFKQALRINPLDADSWLQLGVSYMKLNKYIDSMEAFNEALRINPKNTVALFGLGSVYKMIGDRDRALKIVAILRELDLEMSRKLFDIAY